MTNLYLADEWPLEIPKGVQTILLTWGNQGLTVKEFPYTPTMWVEMAEMRCDTMSTWRLSLGFLQFNLVAKSLLSSHGVGFCLG